MSERVSSTTVQRSQFGMLSKLSGEGAWKGFNDEGSKWLKDNL